MRSSPATRPAKRYRRPLLALAGERRTARVATAPEYDLGDGGLRFAEDWAETTSELFLERFLAASGRWADFPAILGWITLIHAAIGLGEAVITGLVVRFVLLTRPDLVYDPAARGGPRGRRPSPPPSGRSPSSACRPTAPRPSTGSARPASRSSSSPRRSPPVPSSSSPTRA